MGVQTKTIGRQPTDHGPYDPQLAYGKKFIVELFDCGWESKKENNTSAPATLDAQAGTITPNTNDWIKRWGSYKQWLIDNGYQKMDARDIEDNGITQHTINEAMANFVESKGSANGIASLDGSGKVPSSQLPSYVDDVIEGYYYGTEDPETHQVTYDFYTDAEHTQKITPESGKIYLDIPTDKQYRWTGSVYAEISSSIAPDEEDLTNANGVIKFKDKAFSSQDYSGLGRIYLRKNIINNINTLTQSMMTQANTIYIIQYDFTLGEDIIVPANCLLEFDGGSLKNATGNSYKVTGAKTKINTDVAYNIFDDTLGGGFELPFIDLRWVGGVSDYDETTKTGTDNATALTRAIIVIGQYYDGLYISLVGKYYIGTSITTIYDINIRGSHNCARDLAKDYSESRSMTSPSLLAIGSGVTITMNGRNTASEQYKYAYFNIHNIKVEGINVASSVFITYNAGGSPTRVCVMEECEFVHLFRVLFVNNTRDTGIGNLTISKCLAWQNERFIHTNDSTRTLCNLIVRDSNIEHNGSQCFYLRKVFGSITIENCILEGQASPIDIAAGASNTTFNIANNYFEGNTGTVIKLEGYGPVTARISGNYLDSGKIKVNLYNVYLEKMQEDIFADDSVIDECVVNSVYGFKPTWIPLDGMVTFKEVQFGDIHGALNDVDVLKKIEHNIIGTRLQRSSTNSEEYAYLPDCAATDEFWFAFFVGTATSLGCIMSSGGSANNIVVYPKCGLTVVRMKAVAAGDNSFRLYSYQNGEAAKSMFIGAVRAYKNSIDLATVNVWNTSFKYIGNKNNLASVADKPRGLTVLNSADNKLLYWDGSAWRDTAGNVVS